MNNHKKFIKMGNKREKNWFNHDSYAGKILLIKMQKLI